MEKKNTFWSEMVSPVVVLVVICLIAAALLGYTNSMTAPIIAQAEIEAQLETNKTVLPDATDFTELELTDEITALGVSAIYEGDNNTGYVVVASANGYGGAVTVTVGFDSEGKILRVEADVSGETQGVGSKVGVQENMLDKFVGLSGDVSDVSLRTGATLTSNAVRNGVNAACAAVAAIQ